MCASKRRCTPTESARAHAFKVAGVRGPLSRMSVHTRKRNETCRLHSMAGRARRGGMSEARRRRTRSRSHEVDEAAEAIVRHHSRSAVVSTSRSSACTHSPKLGDALDLLRPTAPSSGLLQVHMTVAPSPMGAAIL
eukprot:7377878-Prymnesium_polylepis.1